MTRTIKSPEGFEVIEVRLAIPKGTSRDVAEREAIRTAIICMCDVRYEFNGEEWHVSIAEVLASPVKLNKLQ